MDLQELIDLALSDATQHEADGYDTAFPERQRADNRHLAKVYTETVAILRLIKKVRDGCRVAYDPGERVVVYKGAPETLAKLAELLGGKE